MAASLLIEDESGVYTGSIRHPHNGYWAGEFSGSQTTGCAAVTPNPTHESIRPSAEAQQSRQNVLPQVALPSRAHAALAA